MQVVAVGRASRRSALMGAPQISHWPSTPSRSRCSAWSMAARWSRAWSRRAPTRARSKAIVAPSGSCSSSVATRSCAATMSARSAVNAAICASVLVFSAAKRSAITAREGRAAAAAAERALGRWCERGERTVRAAKRGGRGQCDELADDAGPHGHGHHLGAVAGAELAGDAGQVGLDRQCGQAQLLANLLVGATSADEPQHLDLAAGELRDAVLL